MEAEEPPPKKLRFDQPEAQPSNASTPAPVDDLDDLYGTPSKANTPLHTIEIPGPSNEGEMVAPPPPPPTEAARHMQPSMIPGLGFLSQAVPYVEPIAGTPEEHPRAPEIMSASAGTHVEANGQDSGPTKGCGVGQAQRQLFDIPGLDFLSRLAPRVEAAPAPEDAAAHLESAKPTGDEEGEDSYSPAGASPAGRSRLLPPTNGDVTSRFRLDEPVASNGPSGHASDGIRPSIEDDAPLLDQGLSGARIDQDAPPGEEPEWEVDSSPLNSSDSDESSESDTEDDDDDDDYQLLGPEEQARMLMQGDGGSDDEGDEAKAAKAESGAQLRTKNEVVEVKVEKPVVTITPDMKIEELGTVSSIVNRAVVVKATVSGEYRVLDFGSVLCLQDRTVVGSVAETLGRVQQPYYSVLFNGPAEIADIGLYEGIKVFYVVTHSTYVFTQTLKAFKGSDASNIHDEEVGEAELEFSDDEAEAEHRRRLKQDRRAGRGGRARPNPPSQRPAAHAGGLTYDDVPMKEGVDDDNGEPYTPLARPANFHELISRPDTIEEAPFRNGAPRGYRGGRGVDRGRGRASRGARGPRGRGGAGRGSRQSHGVSKDTKPVPPQRMSPASSSPAGIPGYNMQAQAHGQMLPMTAAYPQAPPPPPPPPPPQPQPLQHKHQHQQISPPLPSGAPSPFAQSYPVTPYGWFPPTTQGDFPFLLPSQPVTPLLATAAASPGGSLPAGAFVNPAFFRNPQSTLGGNQGSPPATQTGYGAVGRPSVSSGSPATPSNADAVFRAAQEKLDILRGLRQQGSGSP